MIIDNGRTDSKNMAVAGISEDGLKAFLKERGTGIKGVLVMTVDGNGRVYLQKKGKPYSIEHIEVKEKW